MVEAVVVGWRLTEEEMGRQQRRRRRKATGVSCARRGLAAGKIYDGTYEHTQGRGRTNALYALTVLLSRGILRSTSQRYIVTLVLLLPLLLVVVLA